MNNEFKTCENLESNKYSIVFENAYKDIKKTMKENPECSIEDVEFFLQNLYMTDGNDWLGRGERQDLINSATIAACEIVLDEWRHEIKDNK